LIVDFNSVADPKSIFCSNLAYGFSFRTDEQSGVWVKVIFYSLIASPSKVHFKQTDSEYPSLTSFFMVIGNGDTLDTLILDD